MFQKLNPDDAFSLVIFHTEARTVIRSDLVKNMDKEDVKGMIYQKFESGGTTIRAGFEESLTNIKAVC